MRNGSSDGQANDFAEHLRSSISSWKRLTIAVDAAILRNDEPAWAAALRERELLGIDLAREPELSDWKSPLRCQTCARLTIEPCCGEEPTQRIPVETLAEVAAAWREQQRREANHAYPVDTQGVTK